MTLKLMRIKMLLLLLMLLFSPTYSSAETMYLLKIPDAIQLHFNNMSGLPVETSRLPRQRLAKDSPDTIIDGQKSQNIQPSLVNHEDNYLISIAHVINKQTTLDQLNNDVITSNNGYINLDAPDKTDKSQLLSGLVTSDDFLGNSLPSSGLVTSADLENEPLNSVEVDPRTLKQRLPVPSDIKQYFAEKVGLRRRGRQIVPGVYSCGHQGGDMFINMINPHYPAHDRVAGTCQFRMLIDNPKVCQVRVDFVDTEMLSPTSGDCADQYLVVSGSAWPTGFHRLCGINPDQHFYLHLDRENAFQHLDFTITSVTSGIPYKFGLWITQIECGQDSSVMAPAGCTQYHFGSQGSLKSFNFEGVQYLNNQNYKICIRSEHGACYGEFRADTNQFMLEPVSQKGGTSKNRRKYGSVKTVAVSGDEGCSRDYILIPGGTSDTSPTKDTISKDRYCGGYLNPKDGETEGASVFTRITTSVFWIQLVTGRPDKGSDDSSLHGPGVRLRYFQKNNCVDTDAIN